MTLKLAPTSAEELDDSSCGSLERTNDATSSRELLRLPLSRGRKEVYNDEGVLVAELPTNDLFANNTNIHIGGNSSGVNIGPQTHFHDPVTVIVHPPYIPQTHNGDVPGIDQLICDKEGPASHQNSKQPFYNCRQLVIPLIFLSFLLLIPLSIFIFKTQLLNRPPNFPPTNPETKNFIEGHPVYSKLNWGALSTKETPPQLPNPAPLVIISHSATNSCSSFKDCANQTKYIQWGFLKDGYRDVGYNFLIGGDGGIYVGRGWSLQNSLRAENAANVLIEEGVNIKKISVDYRLVGENQTSPLRFSSPGLNVMKVIRNWKHYYPGIVL